MHRDNISELLPFLSAQEIEAIILREKPILEGDCIVVLLNANVPKVSHVSADAPDLAEDMAASLVDQLQKDYEVTPPAVVLMQSVTSWM